MSLTNAGQESVLVCVPNWLGDCVMALPALDLLHQRCADNGQRLVLLSKKVMEPFWKLVRTDWSIIPYDTSLTGMCEAAGRIKSYDARTAYVMSHSFRAALLPFWGRVPERFGAPGQFGRQLLINRLVVAGDAVKESLIEHQSFSYARLLGVALDLDRLPLPKISACPEWAGEISSQNLSEQNKIISLLPGAQRGLSKQWPTDRYISLGKELINRFGFRVAVLGVNNESSLCQQVVDGIGESCINLAGRLSFKEWFYFMSGCKAVVSNDSGGMHVAAALKVPTVGIFGITDPRVTGPRGVAAVAVQKSDIRRRQIPRESEDARAALEKVSVEDVLSNLVKLRVLQ